MSSNWRRPSMPGWMKNLDLYCFPLIWIFHSSVLLSDAFQSSRLFTLVTASGVPEAQWLRAHVFVYESGLTLVGVLWGYVSTSTISGMSLLTAAFLRSRKKNSLQLKVFFTKKKLWYSARHWGINLYPWNRGPKLPIKLDCWPSQVRI